MPPDELSSEPVEIIVTDRQAGRRLDVFLVEQFPLYSRSRLRRAIEAAEVTVDGRASKAACRLRAGQRVKIILAELPQEGPLAENIPLEILYEDDFLAAINKPPGMIVHPAAGHWSGTLASALMYHFRRLSSVGGATRPGIVHRLDRDTSGVIVVAKTDRAHQALAEQFATRTVRKHYFALTAGSPDRDRGVVELPIGTHPQRREKMAARAGHPTCRPARTLYEVQERFAGFAAVNVFPRTGRTHQIRVHLAHLGCAVLCDRLYGGRARITRGEIRRQRADEQVLLDRLALHAQSLELDHPKSGQPIRLEAPLAEDIAAVLAELRKYRAVASTQ